MVGLQENLTKTTSFGAFLDPVADKVVVVITLVALVGQKGSLWLTIPSIIIITREVLISALREWMAELGKRASIAVNFVAKLKTTVQMIAIIVLLYAAQPAINVNPMLYPFGLLLLYFASGLTLWSMVVYLKIACPMLFAAEQQNGKGDTNQLETQMCEFFIFSNFSTGWIQTINA